MHEKNVEGFSIGPHALTNFNFKLNATISHYMLKENSTCSVSLLYSRYYLMHKKKRVDDYLMRRRRKKPA